MGKSRPTFRNKIQETREQMEPYRRMLRRQYQPQFDRLFEHANLHAPPGKAADRGNAEWLILFNMVMRLEREIAELQEAIEETSKDNGET